MSLIVCAMVFVCSDYSTIFRSDNLSSFKEFSQVGGTAKKWHTNFEIKFVYCQGS